MHLMLHCSRNWGLFYRRWETTQWEMRCSCLWFWWFFPYLNQSRPTVFEIAAAGLWCGVFSLSYAATVSWAVQRALTLYPPSVSPMSNANHTGQQFTANPAISKLLFHSFISPHRLQCSKKKTNKKKQLHECATTVTVTVMCHITAARTLHYITDGSFSMNTSMRQRLWITVSCYHMAGLLKSRVTRGLNRSELMRAGGTHLWLRSLVFFLSVCVWAVYCREPSVQAALLHTWNVLSRSW